MAGPSEPLVHHVLPPAISPTTFTIGDKVQVVVSREELERLQEGHGGFNPKMLEVVDGNGIVHRMTTGGDVRVQYPGQPVSSYRWTINPLALATVNFKTGDHVRLIQENVEAITRLQQNHGGWTPDMEEAMGKTGSVVKVFSDGDVRVAILNNQEWNFNPACLRAEQSGRLFKPRTSSAKSQAQQEEQELDCLIRASAKGDLSSVVSILSSPTFTAPSTKVIRSSLQGSCQNGHLQVVQELLNRYPSQALLTCQGKTPLQVAAHGGHESVVELLLADASRIELLDARDDEGDSPLHYAAYGKKTRMVSTLISLGADINSQNEKGISVLHIAVVMKDAETVQLLLQQPTINVNIHDVFDDAPLHEAIVKGCADVTALLCTCSAIDLTVINKRGFNCFQYAALKGNSHALQMMMQHGGGAHLVNVCKDDGFSPLQLAALNGHLDSVKYLSIREVGGNISGTDKRGQNPLHCAVHQGHGAVAEFLVEAADIQQIQESFINAPDLDGDTPLHVALRREGEPTSSGVAETDAPAISKIFELIRASSGIPVPLTHPMAIAAFLVSKGAKVSARNSVGFTPLDFVTDVNAKYFLTQYQPGVNKGPMPPQLAPLNALSSPPGATKVDCQICCEPMQKKLKPVRFEPCGHVIVCADCCTRMKRCLECKLRIERKIVIKRDNNGHEDDDDDDEVKSLKTMKLYDLEAKVHDWEEHYLCSICMERKKNVAFLCGHGACSQCVETLRCCHMCRGPISQKINLY
jgi:E3 ubiquitin-protein ligase mind-bomb